MQPIVTPDGRTLTVHEGDRADGFPVVMHHGTPSSGVLYRRHANVAREQGIRLIGYDRPGYGGSRRAAGRSVADAAVDVTAIADTLGLERFASWGISGRGPHALVGVARLAAVAPFEACGLEWLAGMGAENLVEFGKVREGEAALRRYLESIPGADVRIDPSDGHLTLIERRMREVNEWLLSHG